MCNRHIELLAAYTLVSLEELKMQMESYANEKMRDAKKNKHGDVVKPVRAKGAESFYGCFSSLKFKTVLQSSSVQRPFSTEDNRKSIFKDT